MFTDDEDGDAEEATCSHNLPVSKVFVSTTEGKKKEGKNVRRNMKSQVKSQKNQVKSCKSRFLSLRD